MGRRARPRARAARPAAGVPHTTILEWRADADLALGVLYGEYHAVHPSIRPRCVWVMDNEMLRLIRRLAPHPSSGFVWQPPTAIGGVELLLGLPVEIRDGAWGARLEPR